MNNENTANITAADSMPLLPVQKNKHPAFVKKIGRTTYRVIIHFNSTNSETMSDKIKRMLRNEINQIDARKFL